MEFKALNCERCGAGLKVPDLDDLVTCTHCGVTLAPVRVAGELSYLRTLTKQVAHAANTAHRAADEVALLRAEQELASMQEAAVSEDSEASKHYANVGSLAVFAAGMFFASASAFVSQYYVAALSIFALAALFALSSYKAANVSTLDLSDKRRRALIERINTLRKRLNYPSYERSANE